MSKQSDLHTKLPVVADEATRAVVLRNSGEGQWGPCMRALTERQRLYVLYLLETGSDNHTRAAAFAGYSADSYNALRVTAHRLAHDDKIQAAMREEAERRMRASAIMATSRLVEIANDSGHKDQLKAISMVLNRVGLHERTEHKVSVERTPADDQAMVKRIVELCQEMKIDPGTMLGKVDGLVIDAEYQIVGPEPVGSIVGLEDLI